MYLLYKRYSGQYPRTNSHSNNFDRCSLRISQRDDNPWSSNGRDITIYVFGWWRSLYIDDKLYRTYCRTIYGSCQGCQWMYLHYKCINK